MCSHSPTSANWIWPIDAQPSTPSSPRLGSVLAWAIAKIMAGLVAVYRGKFPDVVSSIEQALAAQAAEDPTALAVARQAVAGEGLCGAGPHRRGRTCAGRRRGAHRAVRGAAPSAAGDRQVVAGRRQRFGPARARIGPRRRRCRTPVRSVRRRSRGAAPCGTIWRPHRRGATGGTRRTRQRTPGQPSGPPRCSGRRR